MDIKKLLMGGIVGGILYFGLGYLIFGNLLMSFMQKHPGTAINVDRAQADLQFLYLALGSLAEGFLMAYIFIRANVSSTASGFITGGVVGLLNATGMDCISYGVTNVLSKTAMAVDVAATTVMAAVVGAIIAMVMNMGKKSA